jgi:hypothetical protein
MFAFLMIAVAFGGDPCTAETPGVTLKNCEDLKEGMTVAQIQDLLGPGKKVWDFKKRPNPNLGGGLKWSWLGEWKGTEVTVKIWFDDNDKLLDAIWEFPPGSGKTGWIGKKKKG